MRLDDQDERGVAVRDGVQVERIGGEQPAGTDPALAAALAGVVVEGRPARPGGGDADPVTGGSGDDVLVSGAGDDTLDGGAGFDTASYAQATAGVTVNLGIQGRAQDTVHAGSDTLISIERILGSGYDDTLYAGTATGTINVGSSVDRSTAAHAVRIDTKFNLNANPNIGAATTVPHTTVIAYAHDAVEYYRVAVGQAGTIAFDIDGASGDTQLRLYDPSGALIASSSGTHSDPGNGKFNDAYLATHATTTGFYTVAVALDNSVKAARPGYVLDVSVPGHALTTDIFQSSLAGGDGNDTVYSGGGDDTLDGGDGIDTLSYVAATAGVTVSLATTAAQDTGGAGTDTLTAFENLTGSQYNDVLTGDGGNNVIRGGAGNDRETGGDGDDTVMEVSGNDVIDGGAGVDVLDYSAAANGVHVTLATTVQQDTGVGMILLSNVENLVGSAYDDVLTGFDALAGGGGNDTLVFRRAYSTGPVDSVDGGDGHDTLTLYTYNTPAYVDLATGVTNLGIAVSNIEVLYGTTHDDMLHAAAGDSLYGAAGNDTLYVGAAAAGTLDGGGGFDTLDLSAFEQAGQTVTTDLQGGTSDAAASIANFLRVVGGVGNDHISGSDEFQLLDGGGGDDTLDGRGGDDTLLGMDGNDVIMGSAGLDTIDGGADNDTVHGGDDGDQIEGGDGDDTLHGDAGSDVIDGGAGNDTLYGDTTGNDLLTGGDGADRLYAGDAYGPALLLVAHDAVRDSQAQAISLDGRFSLVDSPEITNATSVPHADVLATTNGMTDWYGFTVAAAGTITLDIDDSRIDTLLTLYDANGTKLAQDDDSDSDPGSGTSNSYLTYQVTAPGTYYVQVGTLVNGNGQQVLPDGSTYQLHVSVPGATVTQTGTGGSSLDGGADNDVLYGGKGDDHDFGGAGDDMIRETSGNDVIDGGDGRDELLYSAATSGVHISLAITGPQDSGVGMVTISNIESLAGTAYDDVLTGDDNANFISTNFGGHDMLSGGGGDDTLAFVTQAGTTGTADGGAGYDTLQLLNGFVGVSADLAAGTTSVGVSFTNIEALTGNGGNDLLRDAPGGSLYGYGGNDTLYVGNGVAGTLDGGDGYDTLDLTAFEHAGQTVATDLQAGTSDAAASIVGLEVVIGGVGDDHVSGTDSIDSLYGFAGDDVLDGRGGGDFLQGADGNDTITGGAGEDYIYGDAGNDIGHGGDGDDVLDGGDGNDVLTGDAGSDELDGGAGNDKLYGGTAGNDVLTGGDGVDKLFAGDGYGPAALFVGHDVVRAGQAQAIALDGRFSLVDSPDITAATTVPHADVLATTNGMADWYSFTVAAAGTITLDIDGSPIDTILTLYDANGVKLALDDDSDGDPGSAALNSYISYQVTAPGVYFVQVGAFQPGGGDQVLPDGSTYQLHVSVPGATVTQTGIGGSSLDGGAGDDGLTGGSGNDVLIGGAGADVMAGKAGDDLYYVDNPGDRANEAAGGGYDTVHATITYRIGNNVEALVLDGHAAIDGTGSADANTLTGNDAANKLYGGLGDDTLIGGDGNDTLVGGGGADHMVGGMGDDVYFVADASDTVVELNGGGADTVRAEIDYTLPDWVETLALAGNARVGTGNALDNRILGSARYDTLSGQGGNDNLQGFDGNDILNGGADNDTLTGGTGRDVMTGGSGADTFRFDDGDSGISRARADEITDFSHAEHDRIDLRLIDAHAATSADDAFTWIGANAFGNHAGELRFELFQGNTYVEGDTNGDGAADVFIRLDGAITPVAGDFLL